MPRKSPAKPSKKPKVKASSEGIAPAVTVSEEPKVGCIYALADPITHDVRYVGQTQNEKRRKWLHCNLSNNRGGRAVCRWIRALLERDLKPIFVRIEQALDLDAREVFWVAEYRRRGAKLLNMNAGGAAPEHFALSPHTLKKGGKHTPLQHIRRQMSLTANAFRAEGRLDLYEKAKKRITDVDAAIGRAERREGKRAAINRINAELSRRHALKDTVFSNARP